MKRSVVVISLFIFSILLSHPAQSATYNYLDIYVPSSTSTWVSDINDAGQIVGTYNSGSGQQGYIFDETGYITDFSFNDTGTDTRFYGINDNGDITGEYFGNDYTGFLYDGTTWTSLEVPGAARTDPQDINDAGQIAGWNRDACYVGAYGFIYDSSSSWTRLANPSTNSYLCDDWGSGGGYDSTAAFGINDSGIVVGTYSLNKIHHGFIYDDGSWSTFDYPDASESRITGINDAGDIVGMYKDDDGNWNSYTGNIYDSNSLDEFSVPGAVSTSLSGINNYGDLVGTYNNGSGNVAFLASSVQAPEPVSSLLFLTGGIIVGIRRYLIK